MENEQSNTKSSFEATVENLVGTDDNAQGGSESQTAEKSYSKLSIYAAFFNGLGVGLLLGLLLGLAVSPVVSAIIGTLSSLLVVLLGLKENYLNPVKSIRIGAFGLFCVVGILTGIYLKNNNSFAPSLLKFYEQYKEIGFSEADSRGLIAYQKFRLIPSEFNFSIPAGTDSLMDQEFQSSRTVMFSSEINAGQCYILKSSNESMSFADLSHNFVVAGGTWEELATSLDPSLPETVRAKTLLLLRDIFCESENSGTIKVDYTKEMQNLNSGDSLDKIKQTIISSNDGTWLKIIGSIDKQIEVNDQKKLYLSLIKILCHD